MTKRRIIFVSIASVLLLLVIGFVFWTQQVFKADSNTYNAVLAQYNIEENRDVIIMRPATTNGKGLVFIPGAKVEARAYTYKLSGLVDVGYTVIITKPYLNLAFFDFRPLGSFTSYAPTVTSWIVGGHSLGGVKACQYAGENNVRGLLLFGSYCVNDVSKPTMSLRGSNDQLTTADDVASNAYRLKRGQYITVPGANHASFGNYGVQPGDGLLETNDALVKDAITNAVPGIQ